VSHELLHHVESNLFFCLMHMFELFEFEFVFEFELSSLEKIKRKCIRHSREKEKPNSAEPAQLGPSPTRAPARARSPLPDRQTPPASAIPHTLSPLLPLAARWSRLVGTSFLHARKHSLSVPQAPLVSSVAPSLVVLSVTWAPPVGTVCPPPPRTAQALRRGRAHDRAFPDHTPTRPSLFWSPLTLTRPPPLSCALNRAPSPSLSLCTHAREARWSVVIHHGSVLVLPSPSNPRRVYCLSELCPVTCEPGHPSVCSLPLCFSQSMLTSPLFALPQLRRSRPVTSPCPGCRS
jgi:hypothetical protein